MNRHVFTKVILTTKVAFFSTFLLYHSNLAAKSIAKGGIESFTYDAASGQISYGSRIYKDNCQVCHGEIGLGYINREESPRILGLTAQEIVDSLIYYRDAESYRILLTGKALLMSRQVLALSNEQINSVARYFEELNPLSKLNRQRAIEKRKILKPRSYRPKNDYATDEAND